MSTQDNGDSTRSASRTTTENSHPAIVLLVDDEDDFRKTLRFWIRGETDWKVREASDGEQALKKLDDEVDVLALDRKMPNLSGSEVVERLSEQDFDGTVVIVSAFEPDSHLSSEMIADYLIKPIDRREFLDTLEQHI